MKKDLSSKKKRAAAGVLDVFLAACISLSAVSAYGIDQESVQLVVTQFPEQGELGRYRLGPEKTFSLSFIHSVSKPE